MGGVRFSSLFTALLLAVLALAAFGAPPVRAQEEACAPPRPSPRLTEYRAVFLACVNDAGTNRLAIRRMRTNDETLLLTVDPSSLATSLEPESCWRCTETTDAEQSQTRFVRALQGPPQGVDTAKAVVNAGLVHSESGSGVFVTGDLCPSRLPLDRGFFERLAREGGRTLGARIPGGAKTPAASTPAAGTPPAATLGPATPVALSISGLWIMHHAADLEWLKLQEASGALAITWVNHSYSHPYAKHRPAAQNYLLTQGLDFDREVYGAERLMIEQGLTPSVFFRYPGLVSDAALDRKLGDNHLVALGADAWLAIGQSPRPGSIVLVHPNGNEPEGIRLLSRLLDQGKLPKPLRPIAEAPPASPAETAAGDVPRPGEADAGILPLDIFAQRLNDARKWLQEVKP
jgi:hypothetical protein